MIAAAIIPTLPVALVPAGLLPLAFGLAAVAALAGFGGLVLAIVRQEAGALGAAHPAPVAIAPSPLSHAA